MIVEYLDLADYIAIAAEITGFDDVTVMKVANLNLADSALHAPSASFGGSEFYPPRARCSYLAVHLGPLRSRGSRLALDHPPPALI